MCIAGHTSVNKLTTGRCDQNMDCCYTVDWAQLAQMWIAQKEVTGVDAETLANLQQPPPLPPPIDAIAMPAMPVGIPPEIAVMSSESVECLFLY